MIEIKRKLLLFGLKINHMYNLRRHSTIGMPASALFIVWWIVLCEIKLGRNMLEFFVVYGESEMVGKGITLCHQLSFTDNYSQTQQLLLCLTVIVYKLCTKSES